MTTFSMFMRKQDIVFIKANIDLIPCVFISEKYMDEEYYKVELMCNDIGLLFIAGEHKGFIDTIAEYKSKEQEMIDKLQLYMDKFTELNNRLNEIIK